MSIEAFAALMARDEPAVAPVLVGLADLIGEACGEDAAATRGSAPRGRNASSPIAAVTSAWN